MAIYDAHLKLGEVKGESKHKDHTGEIQLESFSMGANQMGTGHAGGGSGAGKVAVHDIHCVMKIDKSAPFLWLHTAEGKHFDTATITCRKAGGKQEKFMVVEMKEVFLSGVQIGGSTGGDIPPMVQFSLNAAEISVEYLEQDDKTGTTKSSGKKKVNVRTATYS